MIPEFRNHKYQVIELTSNSRSYEVKLLKNEMIPEIP